MPAPRPSKATEYPELIAMINEIFRTSQGKPANYEPMYKPAWSPEHCANYFVIEEDGKLVSHVGTYPRTVLLPGASFTMAGVGAVCTRPEYRGRGYALQLMRYASQKLAEREVDTAILWTGLKNFYERAGYYWAGKRLVWPLELDRLRTWRLPRIEPVEYTGQAELLAGMHRVRAAEPLRLQRSLEDFALWLTFELRHTWCVVKEGAVQAYVVLSTNYEGKGCSLKEAGGVPELVCALLCELLPRFEESKVTYETGPLPTELSRFLAGRGLQPEAGWVGMVAILRPQALFDRLAQWFARRTDRSTAGKYHFHLDDGAEAVLELGPGAVKHLELAREDFTRLVMGHKEAPTWPVEAPELQQVLPVPWYWPRLEHV